jgi:hypothetical protein
VTPEHDIPAVPISLSESAQARVEIGEEVQALMEHPGWAHLQAGLRSWQNVVTGQLMALSGNKDGAPFSDLTGELKGLAKVEPIARGIVDVGEQAKAQAREAEIKEES